MSLAGPVEGTGDTAPAGPPEDLPAATGGTGAAADVSLFAEAQTPPPPPPVGVFRVREMGRDARPVTWPAPFATVADALTAAELFLDALVERPARRPPVMYVIDAVTGEIVSELRPGGPFGPEP